MCTHLLLRRRQLSPPLRDPREQLGLRDRWELLLQLFPNLVLEIDVTRCGSFRCVGILWFFDRPPLLLGPILNSVIDLSGFAFSIARNDGGRGLLLLLLLLLLLHVRNKVGTCCIQFWVETDGHVGRGHRIGTSAEHVRELVGVFSAGAHRGCNGVEAADELSCMEDKR